MNNLKLKSILFSLMAIVMATVFLTSCDKEEVNPEETVQTVEGHTFKDNFNMMSLIEKQEYLESSSVEQIAALGLEQPTDNINLRGCGSWFTYHTETGNCWTKLHQAKVCSNGSPYDFYFQYRVRTYPFC